MTSPTTPKAIELAAVKGAHGVTGEVRLKLFGEGVKAFKRFRAFSVSGSGQTLALKKVRDDGKGGAIARFEGVSDRNAAEKLRGSVLTVPREELPELDQGEYYHIDLIGLSVVSDTGEQLGNVAAVENFGATDILEIEKPDGVKFMVPLTEHAVPEWDDERLVVNADFVEN